MTFLYEEEWLIIDQVRMAALSGTMSWEDVADVRVLMVLKSVDHKVHFVPDIRHRVGFATLQDAPYFSSYRWMGCHPRRNAKLCFVGLPLSSDGSGTVSCRGLSFFTHS